MFTIENYLDELLDAHRIKKNIYINLFNNCKELKEDTKKQFNELKENKYLNGGLPRKHKHKADLSEEKFSI